MLLFNAYNIVAKAISRGKTPKDVKMLPITLLFGGLDTQYRVSIDLSSDTHNKWGIADIQSVYFDNSTNSSAAILTLDNGFSITAAPYAQAVYPIFFSGTNLNFVVTTSNSNAIINLFFTNTRETAAIWAAQVPIAGTVNVTGSTIYAQPVSCAGTSRNNTIAVGGTSVLIVAANANRKRLLLQNPSSAARQGIAGVEPLYFNFAVAPTLLTGFELTPGASYDTGGGPCSTDAVYFNAATAGHVIIAEEFQ